MKLKLKAYSPQGNSSVSFIDGTMNLKGNMLVKFIENTENIHLLKNKYGQHLFPIEPNTYTVNFLNEINKHHENFKATIHIKDSFMFYVKLNNFEAQQLKWMNKQKWIQKGNNIWIVLPFIVSILGLLITYIVS